MAIIPAQSPPIAHERPRDVIPYWKACLRCLRTLREIGRESLRGPYDDEGFLRAVTEIQREFTAGSSLGNRSVGLWRMESIAFSYCRQGQGTLNRSTIPVEVQPISHTGLGIAIIDAIGFSPEKIAMSIERQSHPEFREFAYEAIGCIFAVYEQPRFMRAFELVTALRFPRFQLPVLSDFVSCFSRDIRLELARGYGRTLYFRKLNVGRAIRAAMALESLDSQALVEGIAFAYAMTNYADFFRVMEVGTDVRNPEIANAFSNGLVFALAIWTWTFPGFLDGLSPQSDRQETLIDCATQLISKSHELGSLTLQLNILER